MPILNPFFSNPICSFHIPDTWLMILLKNRIRGQLIHSPITKFTKWFYICNQNSSPEGTLPSQGQTSCTSIHLYTEFHCPSLIKGFWACYHPLSFSCIHKFSFSPWIHYLLSQNKNHFPGPLISLQLWYHFPAPLYRKTSQEVSILLVFISSLPFSPSPIPTTPSKYSYICHQWAPIC